MTKIKKALDDSGEFVRETLPRPQRYNNGGYVGKRDRLPIAMLVAMLVFSWLVGDVFGLPLPSHETMDFVTRVAAFFGVPAAFLYARRFRP